LEKLLIISSILLSSCGPIPTPVKPVIFDPIKLETLKQKQQLYLELSRDTQAEDGFIEQDTSPCDSLLFSSLYQVAGGDVNIEAARDSKGQWYRRTLALPECLEAKESASTISNDMWVGLFWYMWRNKKLQLAQELREYALNNKYIVGSNDGKLKNSTTTVFSMGHFATLSEIIYALGGTNNEFSRSLPQGMVKSNTGSAAHLDVLILLLRAELQGHLDTTHSFEEENPFSVRNGMNILISNLDIRKSKIVQLPKAAFNAILNTEGIQVLKIQYERQPKNALFSYAYHKFTDGDQRDTMELLLNEAWWPSDRLPTTKDRRDMWLFQRDYGKDWEPDAKEEDPSITLSGGDFLFVMKLLLDDINS
jgi:hypothetical protein